MAGLVKAKKYDWTDSNLALFGSDTERKVKKAAAETEKAWAGAGQKVGLQIWRIVKFKVTHWQKNLHGKFFNGDSYIILNTYKEPGSDELKYDLHFWIGQYSTQDEYGTAAYKTVELDTLLDDKPKQHREVMDHESSLFLSYFSTLELMEGGADTGFHHVKPIEYTPRLLHFHGTKKEIRIRERPLNRRCLDSSDVFILDLGLELYQWNGKTCNKDEKFRAAQYLQALRSERNGKPTIESLDERDVGSSHKFYKSLPDEPLDEDQEEVDTSFQPSLYRLSNESGKLQFCLVSEGSIPKANLDSKDVFIADTGKECFVWIGKNSSQEESQNAMTYAHMHLQKTSHQWAPVTCLKEGMKDEAFEAILS